MAKFGMIYSILLSVGFLNLTTGQKCEISGVEEIDWYTIYEIEILDTHIGETFRNNTKNIIALDYFTGNHKYADFVYEKNWDEISFRTNASFLQYEEYETSLELRNSLIFECESSDNRILSVVHRIVDTNNHAPQFMPGDSYVFKIPELPANFSITPYFGSIIVKDVDLTTYAINPVVSSNEFVDVLYEDRSEVAKQFKLKLVTKRAISSADLPISVKILAFDEDRTGDVPLSTGANLKLEALNFDV